MALAADVSYRIDTFAGSDYVGDNGPATSALLFQAEGIAADSSGNLYISDAANHRVRKITRAGMITTVAGTGIAGFSGDGGAANAAQLNSPYGLAMDGIGNLYVADLGNARVRKISPDGIITTIAGGGSLAAGGSNDGSPATLLALMAPRNLAWDGRGSLFISDFNAHRVYRLAGDGTLTTVAGNGVPGSFGDGGFALRAELNYPAGIASDLRGNLYIGDTQNHLIRKVTAGGIISSIGRAATPTGLAVDSFGTVYIADPSGGQVISIPQAGSPSAFPISAYDLCFGIDGYLYTTDGKFVRRISFTGTSPVIAGGGSLAYGDHGPARLARLNHPTGVTVDSAGNVYIADRDNNRVRRVGTDGIITTVAGTGDAGDNPDGTLSTIAQLSSPSAVAADANGNVFIADSGNHRVRYITGNMALRGVNIPGLGTPSYVLPDAFGNLYVADSTNGTIVEVMAGGGIATIASNLKSPRGLALDAGGNLYVAEMDAAHVKKIGAGGQIALIAEGLWNIPRSVAVDASGNVFVVDTGLQQVYRISPNGLVSLIAGTGVAGFFGDGGDALSAQLGFPYDIAVAPDGTLLIADLNNNRIRQLTPGPATTIAPTAVITAVNAANGQTGPIAPGMLLNLLGTGITSTDSVQVLFNGIVAAVLGADNTRVMVRVPPDVAGQNSLRIRVFSGPVLIGEIAAAVVNAAPALFASVINENGTINSAANPAARGSILVFFGTGEGVSGAPVSLTIGGVSAEILYAGPVLGYPGLLQINARAPAGYVAPGTMEAVVTVGGISSLPVQVVLN